MKAHRGLAGFTALFLAATAGAARSTDGRAPAERGDAQQKTPRSGRWRVARLDLRGC